MAQTKIDFAHFSIVEKQDLIRKCNNFLNWSDGGNWIGTKPKPNCHISDTHKSSVTLTYTFPTNELAEKWNKKWEDLIRQGGHIGTVALTAFVTYLTAGLGSGATSIFIGTGVGGGAAIVKDELQAKIRYPKVVRGGSYEIVFTHEFKWSPFIHLSYFKQKRKYTVRDHQGVITYKNSGATAYKLSELPDGLARSISMAPNKK